MTIRNVLSGLTGLWMMVFPWIAGFSDQSLAVWTCVILGFIQFIVFLAAWGRSGWKSWPNWSAVMTGTGLIIFPFIFSPGIFLTLLFLLFGLTTILVNFYNMDVNE